MKRQAESPFARHKISVATSGRPNACSHQPEEYPVFMTQTGCVADFRAFSQESDSKE